MALCRHALLTICLISFPFWANARTTQPEADDGFGDEDNDERFELAAQSASQEAKSETEPPADGPQLPADTRLLQQKKQGPSPAAPPSAHDAAKADAKNAKEAASVATQAAVVANKVAEHSIKVTNHAKKALKHALGALHDARVESKGMSTNQKESLKKAEAHLREATKKAEHGRLKKVKDSEDLQKEDMEKRLKKRKGGDERGQMREEIEDLRKELKEKGVEDEDSSKSLDELEADLDKSKGPVNDESKAELERLRKVVRSLENAKEAKSQESEGAQIQDIDELSSQSARARTPASVVEADETVTPVQEKGIDIDTQMPYGDLEPFGREDTAQELTESSIKESDEMVDQLERAEVAEEKRAVFRALTRLRGAAITSYDGVARSQTGNIDEYNKIHKWRAAHPIHHLADEESDVSKWAFPDNAD